MIPHHKILWVLLLCLGTEAASIHAQSRGGSGSGRTVTPNLLPVQSYAVIDLGGAPDSTYTMFMALDDNVNVAYGYKSINTQDADFTVTTYRNGVLSTPVVYPGYSIVSNVEKGIIYNGLTPTGKVVGIEIDNQWINQGEGAYLGTYGLIGDTEQKVISPFDNIYSNVTPPGFYYPRDSSSGINGYSASGQCSYYFTYNYVHNPAGDPTPPTLLGTDIANVLYSSGQTIFFAPDAPSFLTDSASTRYIRQKIAIFEINDTGMALLGSSQNASLWDGQQVVTDGIPQGRYSYCLNNQGWFLTSNGYYSADADGGFWNASKGTKFTDVIKGGGYEHQLKTINPFIISNQNAIDGSLFAVTELQDNGSDELAVWKAVPAPIVSQNLPSGYFWQPYRMQFPAGVNTQSLSFEVISSSGVIAAIGNAGAGDNHALLLVPIQLNQTNYPTSLANYDDGNSANRVIQNGNGMGSIAYINRMPIMPQLQVQLAGGTLTGLNVLWRMTAKSERAVRGGSDNVSIPVPPVQSVTLPSNQAWNVSDYMVSPADFFGGKCAIYYTIQDTSGNNLTPELEFDFLIRGKNAMDADTKAYIVANEGSYFYAWAIAQNETRTPSNKIYNQFATANGSSWGDLGQPFYATVEGNGWGLFQRDPTHGGVPVTTQELYNWKVNTSAAITELNVKQSLAQGYFTAVQRTYPTQYQAPPDNLTVWGRPSDPSTSTTLTAMDAAIITLYNGASVVTKLQDGGTNSRGQPTYSTYLSCWKFFPNNPSGSRWRFVPNGQDYVFKVIYNEYEHHLSSSE